MILQEGRASLEHSFITLMADLVTNRNRDIDASTKLVLEDVDVASDPLINQVWHPDPLINQVWLLIL